MTIFARGLFAGERDNRGRGPQLSLRFVPRAAVAVPQDAAATDSMRRAVFDASFQYLP